MFGNPQWFRVKKAGWGLVPTAWQGWAYAAAWAGGMVLPFLMLLARHQAVEAMVWMGMAVAALSYDVSKIRRAIRP